MIRKTAKGFVVKSEAGKNLSKPNLSLKHARIRLGEIEAFKHMKGK